MLQILNPIFIISILIALSVHEWSHGMVAHLLGDPTAEEHGRLTLNPLAHIDPLGALFFLLAGIGWGKPVPVNPAYFRHPRRDTALVSLAGPVSNLLLALVSFLCLLLVSHARLLSVDELLNLSSQGSVISTFFQLLFASSLFVNLGLMAFNLLPIAPLDGSKIIQIFIPMRYEEVYDRFLRIGPFFLLILLLMERFLSNVPLLSAWIYGIMNGVLTVFVVVFGRL